MGELKVIDVTCALIIDDQNRMLVAQRSKTMSLPLKWELPGGKIELNETAEDCLVREIKEELDIEIEVLKKLEANKHTYPNIIINLIPFISKHINGIVTLKEHTNYKWLSSNELLNLDWAEADLPILYNYLNYNSGTPQEIR